MKDVIYSIISIGLCVLLGKLIAHLIGTLPSSLYGLICFTTLLHYKILNAERIKVSIEWAISNMGVLFVPSGVGIINHFELIKNHGLSIVFIIFLSTFILLSFVGIFFEQSLKRKNKSITPSSKKAPY
jgi:holin-like protein